MELSEAKERLTYINQAYDFGDIYSIDDLEAIDTVLKALQKYEKQIDLDYVRENYIPKEKVRETLKECQKFIDEFENNEKDSIKEYKQLVNDYDVGLKQGVKAEIEMWKKNKMEYVHKRNILMELLGE